MRITLLTIIIIQRFEWSQALDHNYISCSPGHYPDFTRSYPTCKKCKGGFYGARGATCDEKRTCLGDVSENCTDLCEEGYLCPAGSSSPRQQPCGSPEFYCPQGSERRVKVKDGFYSTPTIDMYERFYNPSSSLGMLRNITLEKRESEMHRTSESFCEPAYFCEKGLKYACSEFGSYGISKGLKTKICNGPCPIGFFCLPGIAKPMPCPAGSFGNRMGEKRPTCEGLCSPGYYCEEGSTR